jgi:RNA recognition motif-containing protein
MRDRATGRPRGFGFVTYRDPVVVDRVVREVHVVDGRQVSGVGAAAVQIRAADASIAPPPTRLLINQNS